MRRRDFLKLSALSVAVLTLVPGWVFLAKDEPRWKRGNPSFPVGRVERFRFIELDPIDPMFQLPDRRCDKPPAGWNVDGGWMTFPLIKAKHSKVDPTLDHFPIGEIAWGMANVQIGPGDFDEGEYLYCDGRWLKVSEHPELAKVIAEHPNGLAT